MASAGSNSRTCCVTGACGLVGRRLVEMLVDRGATNVVASVLFRAICGLLMRCDVCNVYHGTKLAPYCRLLAKNTCTVCGTSVEKPTVVFDCILTTCCSLEPIVVHCRSQAFDIADKPQDFDSKKYPGVEWQKGDLTKPDDVARAVKGAQCVYHIGALVGPVKHKYKSKWRNIWIRHVFCYRIPAPLVLGAKHVSNPA